MTLYELVNNATIQGNVTIIPTDKDGKELGHFHVNSTDDLAYAGWDDEWEDWGVGYIFVDQYHNLVIEIREQEDY